MYCQINIRRLLKFINKGLSNFDDLLSRHSIENTELMTILGLLYLRMGDNIEAFQYFGR